MKSYQVSFEDPFSLLTLSFAGSTALDFTLCFFKDVNGDSKTFMSIPIFLFGDYFAWKGCCFFVCFAFGSNYCCLQLWLPVWNKAVLCA